MTPPTSNTFLTPTIIAREALSLLQSEIVAPFLFTRKYEAEFKGTEKVGQSVTIRRRQKGHVGEFATSITSDGTKRKMTETSKTITLEKHFDASIPLDPKDLTLELKDFSEQVLAPHIVEMAEKVDTYALTKVNGLCIPPDALGTIAAPAIGMPSSLANFARFERTANELLMPRSPRVMLLSPAGKESILGAQTGSTGTHPFTSVDKAGTDNALRRAYIDEIMGFNVFMGQNVAQTVHTAGTLDPADLGIIKANVAAGATSFIIDNLDSGSSETIVAGDFLRIVDSEGNYYWVQVATGEAEGNTTLTEINITITEPVRALGADHNIVFAAGAEVAKYGSAADTWTTHGGVFHPDALAFFAVPLVPPVGAPSAMIQDPVTGLAIRAVWDYDIDSKEDILSLDCLVGAAVVDDRLGYQLHQY